jgi:hypothetical protein
LPTQAVQREEEGGVAPERRRRRPPHRLRGRAPARLPTVGDRWLAAPTSTSWARSTSVGRDRIDDHHRTSRSIGMRRPRRRWP